MNGQHAIRNIKTYWTLHLAPFFGQIRAAEVTNETIARYVDQRLQAGAKNATVNRETACLKRMFNLGLEKGKVIRCPQFPAALKEKNVRKGFVEDGQYAKLAVAWSREGL